jgi:hypothetical protein
MKTIYLNFKYFLKNLYFVYFKSESKAYSFAGYGRTWLSKKYADKRTSATSKDGITGRKRHYCFPYSNNIIMVANRSEVNQMVTKKIISKRIDIKYMMEHATYISHIIALLIILSGCQKDIGCRCVTYHTPAVLKNHVFYTHEPWKFDHKTYSYVDSLGNKIDEITICDGDWKIN